MSGKHLPHKNLLDATSTLDLTELHELLKVVQIPEIISLDDGSEIKTLGQYLARDENIFTLIAPNDEAIIKYRDDNPELFYLSEPTSHEQLRNLIYYHMVEGEKDFDYILSRHKLTSYLSGREIPVCLERKTLFLGNGRVTEVDNKPKNGIIHIVDSVLVPVDGWNSGHG